jgi:hypothetical protein
MNASQSAMYFGEFGKLRDVLRARGKNNAEIEAHRHALTRRALGVDKSSKDFTNADLDKVLARIKAEREPGNLNAQLALLDSPEKRRELVLNRCFEACSRMWSHGNDTRLMHREAQLGYIRGTAKNVVRKSVEDCTAEDLAKVLGCLQSRLERLESEVAAKVATARGGVGRAAGENNDDGEPF